MPLHSLKSLYVEASRVNLCQDTLAYRAHYRAPAASRWLTIETPVASKLKKKFGLTSTTNFTKLRISSHLILSKKEVINLSLSILCLASPKNVCFDGENQRDLLVVFIF